MSIDTVQIQGACNGAPWNDGGMRNMGNRANPFPVAWIIRSMDNGKSFNGTMTCLGDGPSGRTSKANGRSTDRFRGGG